MTLTAGLLAFFLLLPTPVALAGFTFEPPTCCQRWGRGGVIQADHSREVLCHHQGQQQYACSRNACMWRLVGRPEGTKDRCGRRWRRNQPEWSADTFLTPTYTTLLLAYVWFESRAFPRRAGRSVAAGKRARVGVCCCPHHHLQLPAADPEALGRAHRGTWAGVAKGHDSLPHTGEGDGDAGAGGMPCFLGTLQVVGSVRGTWPQKSLCGSLAHNCTMDHGKVVACPRGSIAPEPI